MQVYNYILNYFDKINFCQIKAKNFEQCIKLLLDHIEPNKVLGMGPKSYFDIFKIIENPDDYPKLLDSVINIWTSLLFFNKNRFSVDINIFLGSDLKEKKRELFSFCFFYLGGTYISQVEARNIEEAVEKWIKLVQTKEKYEIWKLGDKLIEEMEIILKNESKPKAIINAVNSWHSDFKLNHGRYPCTLYIMKTSKEIIKSDKIRE